jgi:type I restriction enzyme S subunit
MTEENKSVKNFPNLRFPGFKGEWETVKLGDITSWCSGGTPSKENPSFWDGEIPWISASSMRGHVYSDSELKITEAGLLKGSRLAKKGSLLILVRGSMLFNKIPIGIVSKDVAFNQDVKSIVVNEKSSSEYILYWFLAFEPKILNIVSGTGIGAGKLDIQDLKSLECKIPNLTEQKKIGDFLNLISQRIISQKKIIEQLETLMKWNLEKIFCQKLRFKNKQGNYFSDWRTTILNEICDIKKGEQLNKDDLTETGNYPCLNGGMGFSGYTDKFNSDENTITISEGGNSCGFVSFMKSKFWLGGHCYKIILKKDISTIFLFHLFKFYERKIMNLRVGSGLPNIQQKDLRSLQLLVSENIEEQTKIANYLSSIQEKTETEKQILEKLELHKKFLLANLFV